MENASVRGWKKGSKDVTEFSKREALERKIGQKCLKR